MRGVKTTALTIKKLLLGKLAEQGIKDLEINRFQRIEPSIIDKRLVTEVDRMFITMRKYSGVQLEAIKKAMDEIEVENGIIIYSINIDI